MNTSTMISDDGTRLHYEEEGAGPVSVVYLHDIGGRSGLWRELWEVAAPCGCRHVGLDFRGHGDSPAAPRPFSAGRLARDVLNLADHLGLTRFAVVGHGLGGKVALRLTSLAPGRITRIILLGAVGPGSVAIEPRTMLTMLRHADDPAFVREFFRLWFHVWPADTVDRALESLRLTARWALRAACHTAFWTDLSADIPALPHPSLVLAGALDPILGPGYQRREVLPFLRHARVDVIPGCGHGLFLENPHAVAHACAAFLTALPPTGRRTNDAELLAPAHPQPAR